MSLRRTEEKYPIQLKDEGNTSKPLSTLASEMQKISVIIPTLNESGNIADLLVRLDQAMVQAGICYEAIVVDDRSIDNTCEVAASIAGDKFLPVSVLTKQGQPGKSFSLIEGFAAAQFDVLAMIDGDLQYPPEALPEMMRKLEHADIVVGDRRVTYGSIDRFRGILSDFFTSIINILFGLDLDMQSGLKVFRRRVYEGIELQPGKWSFDLHLITRAVHKGYAIANVPITYAQRNAGESKVMPLAVAIELLMTALLLKMILSTHNLLSGFGKRKQKGVLQQYSVASDKASA